MLSISPLILVDELELTLANLNSPPTFHKEQQEYIALLVLYEKSLKANLDASGFTDEQLRSELAFREGSISAYTFLLEMTRIDSILPEERVKDEDTSTADIIVSPMDRPI